MTEIWRIPVDRELCDRVRWLIAVRWVILTVATVMALAANHWLGGVLPAGALWWTLVGIAVYNLAFWLIATRLTAPDLPHDSHVILLHAQVIADLLALTMLLHFSGGLENPFSAYYVLVVMVGSILTTKGWAYTYAGIATLLWVGLLLAEAWGIIPHYNLAGFRLAVRHKEAAHILAESFVLATANLGAAYLSASIIDRLREGERQLYIANSSCELRAGELAELNRQLQEANASCELRAGELADLNRQLQEAHLSCELRAGELAELNQRLRDYDRQRGMFLRLVTHELRAPVAAIQSYLRLILDGYVPAERTAEIIGKAEQRARDQLDLISDLLDLARAQEPRQECVVPVDLAASLRDVVDMMQARINDKKLELTLHLDAAAPPVAATPEHIKQVWTNLVSNAVKYTPDGGAVTITLEARGEMVYGAVRDTGIGISAEDQKHIFENFFRTEQAKAMAQHSTGLGLSIVKGIVERYGGHVGLESQVGVGSVFYFELPRAEEGASAPEATT